MKRIPAGRVSSVILFAVIAACSQPATNLPATPSIPFATGVILKGPDSIAPGQSAQFSVLIRLSDGTTKNASTSITVRFTSNNSILQVNSAGLATAQNRTGEAVLSVDATQVSSRVTFRATKEILILPDGTYRVVGTVNDAEYPTQRLDGVSVQAVPGPAPVTTDQFGNYKLYGVPADAELRVTKDGYQTFVQGIHLTSNSTMNFLLVLAGPRLNLSGPHLIEIDVTGSCTGSFSLPDSLRHRKYDALITQNNGVVDVVLTSGSFRVDGSGKGNHFTGQVSSTGATFQLDDVNYYYYYFYYYYAAGSPSVVEILSNTSVLIPAGKAVANGSPAKLTGSLSSLTQWTVNNSKYFWSPRGCYSSSGITMTITPK